MKLFGREIHLDVAKNGEPWDLSVLVSAAADGEMKHQIVPYYVHFGVLKPQSAGRPILHLVFFRLMLTVYGKDPSDGSK